MEGTHRGRTFAVAGDGHGGWRELDERGRRVGPVLRRSDVERLERVSSRGRLDGCDVDVVALDDGRVAVRGLPLPRAVVEAHGLTGNPRDGLVGTVDPHVLTDVYEERQEMSPE